MRAMQAVGDLRARTRFGEAGVGYGDRGLAGLRLGRRELRREEMDVAASVLAGIPR